MTRLLRYLTDLQKSYVGEVVLGTTTSTLDASGDVVATFDMNVTLDDVRAAASKFIGEIEQVPPMVSAVKIGGERLHAMARRGEEVERAPRRVTVSRLDVESTDEPLVFRIDVDCSSGTYIRSLAADIGTALDGGAHLRNLRRTAIGSFSLPGATPLEAVNDTVVITPAEALRDYPSAVIGTAELTDVSHGRKIEARHEGPWRVLDSAGELVAVYEGDRAAVVLSPA